MSRTAENDYVRVLKEFKFAVFRKEFHTAEVILDYAKINGWNNFLALIPLSTKNPEQITQFSILKQLLKASPEFFEKCLDAGLKPFASDFGTSILDQAELHEKPEHYKVLKEKGAHSLTRIYQFIDGISDENIEDVITSNSSFADAIFACANSEMCDDKFEMVSRILNFGKGKFSLDVTSSCGVYIKKLFTIEDERYAQLAREFDEASKPSDHSDEEVLVVDDGSPGTISIEGPLSPDLSSCALSVSGDSIRAEDDI